MKKLLTFVLLTLLASLSVKAQELSVQVKVDASNLQTTELRIFRDMENQFRQFLNDRNWTDEEYELFERVQCVLAITISSSPSTGTYNAQVQIQSVRPVFNSTYQTVVFNYADRDWQFNYTESQPINFAENGFNENLPNLLAYYAYMILGFDRDTFENLGGNEFYTQAQQIVQTGTQSGAPGWEQFGDNNNRYWLNQNVLNSQLSPVREALYLYHRKGLDLFESDPETAKTNILEALKKIQSANKLNANSVFINTFIQTKSDELVQIFSEGDLGVRRQVYTILREIAPSNADTYESIIN